MHCLCFGCFFCFFLSFVFFFGGGEGVVGGFWGWFCFVGFWGWF